MGETALGKRSSKKMVHILLKTLPVTLAFFSEIFKETDVIPFPFFSGRWACERKLVIHFLGFLSYYPGVH